MPELGSLPEIVPLCVFGGVGVLGGLVALVLPDTVGFPLPNTFEDVEDIKRNQKRFWTIYRGSESLTKRTQQNTTFGTFSQTVNR